MSGPEERIDDVVVNATMNRGRGLTGVNSYERELRRFDIAAFLRCRAESVPERRVRWLDACCGAGRALTEAADDWTSADWARRITLIGIDLYDGMPPDRNSEDGLRARFVVGDVLTHLPPQEPLDLVTCIHGLHYLPDKLAFLEQVYTRLVPDGGLLLAHLDPANVKLQDADNTPLWPRLLRHVRRQGISLKFRAHLIRLERTLTSPATLSFGATYATRTVAPRPNYSGMIGVDSWYTTFTETR